MPLLKRQTIRATSVYSALSRQRGQSLVETLAGFVIILPLALFAIDLTTMVVTSQMNEHLAEDAARAAANQLTSLLAMQAAKMPVDDFPKTAFITKVSIQQVDYDPAAGQVTVTTEMEVNLPISWSSFGKVTLHANSTQPIVATPAPI